LKYAPSKYRNRLRAVLFDWDGTLVDSAEASYLCYQRLFESFGISFDRDRFERTYSPDWYATYRAVGLPESQWSDADARWLDQYKQTPNALLPGAFEALRRLVNTGLRLGLVTSGDRSRVRHETVALGVFDLFEVLVCAHDVPRPKPAPDPLLRALSLLSIPASRALYVGDSPEDVSMAHDVGVFSIGIPGGFPNREALLVSRPDYLARDLADAVSYIIDYAMTDSRYESPDTTPSGGADSSPEGAPQS
jgi:HAD superfamily hydrolase (TIGR01549 family)